MTKDKRLRSLAEVSQKELRRAWYDCALTTRRVAGNFYYAFIFLPKDKRRGIQSLYSFLRIGDDIADSSARDAGKQLSGLEKRLDLCYAGYYNDSSTLALAHAIGQFGFQREHFTDMFLGLKSDLTVKRYKTFEELKLYCYRVASTVGLLCLRIFNADTPKARIYAENLGIGMQLTNILRDIKEDYTRDRIYLPQEDFSRFKVLSGKSLFNNNSTLKDIVHYEGTRAQYYFERARKSFPPELEKELFAAEIMGKIYKMILEKILKSDNFDQRITLTRKEKLSVGYQVISGIGKKKKDLRV